MEAKNLFHGKTRVCGFHIPATVDIHLQSGNVWSMG